MQIPLGKSCAYFLKNKFYIINWIPVCAVMMPKCRFDGSSFNLLEFVSVLFGYWFGVLS